MSNISNVKKLFWACLCVTAAACTKTSNSPERNGIPDSPPSSSTNVKLYPVKFNIGSVEVKNGRYANKEMSAKDYLHFMFYAAYDSTGHLVSKIVQDSTAASVVGPEFGILRDSLPAGTYTVIIAGAVGRPYEGSSDTTLNSLYFTTNSDDVFYKKFALRVNEKDTATSTVRLSRITGQLQLNLKDTLPPEVKEVRIVIDSFPLTYHPQNDMPGMPSNNLFGFNNNPNSNLSLTAGAGFFGSTFSHIVTITALGHDGQVLRAKTVKNVYVYPNRKTVLTGALYTSAEVDSTSAISVTIDTDYGETIIQNF
jgi:hypothetical protein